MENFQIKAIREDFNHLFSLSDSQLREQGARKILVDNYPGFPCRISLVDAPIGEEVVLLPFKHHNTDSPYQASGPIFVRKNVIAPELEVNEIPKILHHRFLSLRGYDSSGMMIETDTCHGSDVQSKLQTIFENSVVSYVHIHNAKPGCYNCVAERI